MANTKNKITTQVHLFTVDNDEQGRNYISNFRNLLKLQKSPHRLILYGRGHRFGKGRSHAIPDVGAWGGIRYTSNEFQSHIPLEGEEKAQRIAVYIISR